MDEELRIHLWGDPVLHTPSKTVKNIDSRVKNIVEKMIEMMHTNAGIGFAAPQAGIGERIIVVDPFMGEKPEEIVAMVNPEILESEGVAIREEGCLSIPQIREEVKRPFRVLVKGITLDEREVKIEAEDLLARIFCHEIDHLNGKFFIDHLSPLKRRFIKNKLKKLLFK
ncbi:MAG: peptide deformylase [Candidatus Aminicenantia bacterium]